MMALFKYTSFVFALVMANGFLVPTLASPTQDPNGNVLWDKIWKHIQSDDKLIQETREHFPRPSSNAGNGLPLSGDGKQWMALLQKYLEGREQTTVPVTATTITKTPTTTPVVKSKETLDVQKLLSFITKSKMDVNNDQWMSLLKFILSTETMKDTPKAVNHQSTLTPTTVSTNEKDSKNRNEMDGIDWAQSLQKLFDNEPAHKGEKDTPNTHDIVSTTTMSPKQPSGSISDEQWQLLLERYLNGNLKQKDNSLELSTSPSVPTMKRTTPVTTDISDDQWQLLLNKYLNENLKQKDRLDIKTPTSSPSTKSPASTTTSNISDEQWKFLLDQYLNENLKQKDTKLNTLTPSSSPSTNKKTALETNDISNEQWQFLLQKYLNLKQKDELDIKTPTSSPSTKSSTPKTTSNISDEQWQFLLDQYLNENLKQKDTKLNTLAPSLSASPSTQKTTTTLDIDDISNEQWQSLLQQYLNAKSLQKESNSESPTSSTNIAKTSDISDKQWETLLGQYLSLDKKDEKLVTSTPSSTSSTSAVTTTNRPVTTVNNESENPDKQWENILQQMLDESSRQKDNKLELETTTHAARATSTASQSSTVRNGGGSDHLADEEWRHLLDQTLNEETPLVENSGKSQQPTTKPRVSPQNKAFPTPPFNSNARDENKFTDEEWTKLLDDENKLTDKEWTKLLDDMLGNHGSQSTVKPGKSSTSPGEVKTTATTGTRSTSHKPVTDERISQRNNDVTTASPTAQNTGETTDEQWEHVLKLILDEESNENIPSSPPPHKKTGRPILPREITSPKEPRAEKMLGIEKVENTENEDNTYMYMILAAAGGLLFFLVIIITLLICRKKKVLCWSKKEMHSTILNSDLNRFDLQVLRPSKENMNAFLYSIPAFGDETSRY